MFFPVSARLKAGNVLFRFFFPCRERLHLPPDREPRPAPRRRVGDADVRAWLRHRRRLARDGRRVRPQHLRQVQVRKVPRHRRRLWKDQAVREPGMPAKGES